MRQAVLLAFLALTACATTRSSRTIQEVLEGNSASYPAFLAAAQRCGFSAFEQKSDGMGGTHYLLSFPYRMDAPSLCVVRWVEQNPQAGLVLSGH